ncbi:hypothetical protein AB1N83_000935 [Pleurotus pulmonarius]
MVSLPSHSSVHLWRDGHMVTALKTSQLSPNTLATAPILRLREMNGLNRRILCQMITPRPIFSSSHHGSRGVILRLARLRSLPRFDRIYWGATAIPDITSTLRRLRLGRNSDLDMYRIP